MFRALSHLLLPGLCFSSALIAGVVDRADYLTARQALADGLPEVAAVKVERLLKDKGLSKEDAALLAQFATEAWIRAGDGARALDVAGAYDFVGEPFWRAQAYTLLGRLSEAREELASSSAPLDEHSQLLLGRILLALGEAEAARAEAQPLFENGIPEIRRHAGQLLAEIDLRSGHADQALKLIESAQMPKGHAEGDLLRARALLDLGRLAEAREALHVVLGASGGGQQTRDAAETLMAEIWMREKQPIKAYEHLIQLLDDSVESNMWTEMFDALDRTWRAQPPPHRLPSAVLLWAAQGSQAQQSADPPPALQRAIDHFRGHAWYIVARWLQAENRPVEAVSMIEALLRLQPDHPRTSAAMRMAMDLHAAAGVDSRVLELAEKWRERFSGAEGSAGVDFLAGSILFRLGEHQQAEESFQAASNVTLDLSERRRSLFNAAVAASKAADAVLFLGLMAQLEATGGAHSGTGDSAADLQLEKALEAAAKRRDGAGDDLRAFINSRSTHPRIAEAQVALAEWLLITLPPRVDESRAILDAIRIPAGESVQAEALRQRIDYTRLWMIEVGGDTKGLVTAASDFIKKWPQSSLVPDVLMKQAASYYQLEDFANARAGFEQVARDYAKTPHHDTALYFAALSAISVMSDDGRKRALTIWEELAAKGGSLALPSRRQQALAHRRLGELPEALKALDQILDVKLLDEDTRRLTTCEKAEVLLLLGKTDPTRLEEAVSLLNTFISSEHETDFLWKARAGYTLAVALHDAKRDTLALEACYDVLRAADETPPANPTDYAWYSKAGFFGIDLLQATHQWEAAARLAEQISQFPGGRAEDARQLATKIRLEHFLWDGPKPVPPRIPETAKPEESKSETIKPEKGN